VHRVPIAVVIEIDAMPIFEHFLFLANADDGSVFEASAIVVSVCNFVPDFEINGGAVYDVG
jgi:hypothetical protein